MSLYHAHTFDNQNDGLALLDENDSVNPNDKTRGIETPDGFRI